MAMIYFLVPPARKFIHMHCIKPRGLLNGNTCDHPRCSLLYFNPLFSTPFVFRFPLLHITVRMYFYRVIVSNPDLFLVFVLHFLIFASLIMFSCLQSPVWKTHKNHCSLATAAIDLFVCGHFRDNLLRNGISSPCFLAILWWYTTQCLFLLPWWHRSVFYFSISC